MGLIFLADVGCDFYVELGLTIGVSKNTRGFLV